MLPDFSPGGLPYPAFPGSMAVLSTRGNHKRLRFLFGMARFFCFGRIAEAEFRPAANFYAYPGGEAGAGYQGAYIVGGKGEKGQTAGGQGPPGGPAGKPAFPRFFRQPVPAPPGGAGADGPGGGIQRLGIQLWRLQALQRVQFVYPAPDKIRVNAAGVFFQFRFYVSGKGIPHPLFLHCLFLLLAIFMKSRRI
jgi:hypothetical protein